MTVLFFLLSKMGTQMTYCRKLGHEGSMKTLIWRKKENKEGKQKKQGSPFQKSRATVVQSRHHVGVSTPILIYNATSFYTSAFCQPYFVNAATTAHNSSLVFAFRLSASGSSSSSCRTLFMARSYWSSRSGAKAFSRTSEE